MKKSTTRKMTRGLLSTRGWLMIVGTVLFGCTLLYGAFWLGKYSVSHQLASGAVLEQARRDIAKEYLAASSTDCADASDPSKPQDRVAVFYQYLRVNRYANRAVIRGCNNNDTLLAKTTQGWERTSVNIALDLRANPSWQKACLITDITRADTVVRPENASIDGFNLKECNYIATHNRVPTWEEAARL